MRCDRCKNEDSDLIYELNGKYYCRKCISFNRVEMSALLNKHVIQSKASPAKYKLDFTMTLQQTVISKKLVDNFRKRINSYVFACTGSGKTEVCYEVIKYALNNGYRVCFCIPRTELVKELYTRIRNDFYNIEIGLLYGGKTHKQQAQFIICTTHQLYKFIETGFDLMILHEVDAFPFYNDQVLNEIFNHCCRGNFIKLSATFLKEDIINGDLLIMNRRYHNNALPVPFLMIFPKSIQKYLCLFVLLFSKKHWIVFAATIQDVYDLNEFLSKFILVKSISSKTLDKDKVLLELKEKKIKAIVSTTLLERGITIDDIQVMVLNTSHRNFDSRTLIQISGRVGRKKDHPTGKVIFLTDTLTDGIKQCIKTLKFLNRQDA